MRYQDLDDLIVQFRRRPLKGPVGVILVEDLVEVESTIRHHLALGFRALLVFAPDELRLAPDLEENIHRIPYNLADDGAMTQAVNKIIGIAQNEWIYYCYNAEYLFFPFCETRTVGEMLDFNTEERRDSVLTYVIDLYAGDLWEHQNAVSLDDAHLDKSGYYALARKDEKNHPRERQLDFFGGLRWRFEEHIAVDRRKIDRVGLFYSKRGLRLRPDHTFNIEEYNTYACPWHHNVTAAICSFRTAKALKTNPGSTFEIENFRWHNSTEFKWHSQQLLDLGLMEPGQWF